MGTSKIYDSGAAFDLKSLNLISPRVSQGLQIGGTSGATIGIGPLAIGRSTGAMV
jgi:hypothetical protein